MVSIKKNNFEPFCDFIKSDIPYLPTDLLSVLLIKLPSSSHLTSSPGTTTTEVSPSDSTPANDQCQEDGLYYEIDTLKSTIEQANQETKGKIIKYLTPNTPQIQLWCARSKWNMDLKIIFSS